MRGNTPRHTREGAAYGTHGFQHTREGSNSQRDSYKRNSPEEQADAIQEGPYTGHHPRATRQEAMNQLAQQRLGG